VKTRTPEKNHGKKRSSPAYPGKEEKLAQEILAKLERGISFDHLAKRYSKCPSGRNGGDLGEFQQARWSGRSIRRSSAARCSNPTARKTKFGYHIIKVLYRR
jgi:peptidyl-prolyl cis-trans isomerase C